MTLQLFEPPRISRVPHALDDGPMLVCAPSAAEVGDPLLRIRARRLLPTTPEDLFAAWTRRAGWESWLRPTGRPWLPPPGTWSRPSAKALRQDQRGQSRLNFDQGVRPLDRL